MAASEEARAVAYRAQQTARATNEKARLAALAGDPTERAALAARWAPLLAWLRERRRW